MHTHTDRKTEADGEINAETKTERHGGLERDAYATGD